MDRLLLFPEPFPDESLYSLAVRYHRLVANDSYRRTSQELFGTYSRTCGSVLPCCLGHLSQRLGELYSVEELVESRTLLPLYKPFLNDSTYESAVRCMEGYRGTGLKMSLGITASGLLKHASFRYCEACLQKDIQDYGVPFWHRIHMAAGVCACPHHGNVLLSAPFPSRADWRCMLLPGECPSTPVLSGLGLRTAGTIAEMQFWGLANSQRIADLLRYDFLKSRLSELGMLERGRLKEHAIKAYVECRFNDGPRECEFQTVIGASEWILRLLRRRGRTIQPFHFYYLCWVLELVVDDLEGYELNIRIQNSSSINPASVKCSLPSSEEIARRRWKFTNDSSVRCHDKTGYYWLYHNDRVWLKSYIISHQFFRGRKARVDWVIRDLILSRDLVTAHDKLMVSKGKPIKITKSALIRHVCEHYNFLRQPSNFLISIKTLEGLLETEHDYQIRKIIWAINLCHVSKHHCISVLLRTAGIRVRCVSNSEIRKFMELRVLGRQLAKRSGD